MLKRQKSYESTYIVDWLNLKADDPHQLEQWLQGYNFPSTICNRDAYQSPYYHLLSCIERETGLKIRERKTRVGNLLAKRVVKILNKQPDMHLEDRSLYRRPKEMLASLFGLASWIYPNKEIANSLIEVIGRLDQSTNQPLFMLIGMGLCC